MICSLNSFKYRLLVFMTIINVVLFIFYCLIVIIPFNLTPLFIVEGLSSGLLTLNVVVKYMRSYFFSYLLICYLLMLEILSSDTSLIKFTFIFFMFLHVTTSISLVTLHQNNLMNKYGLGGRL